MLDLSTLSRHIPSRYLSHAHPNGAVHIPAPASARAARAQALSQIPGLCVSGMPHDPYAYIYIYMRVFDTHPDIPRDAMYFYRHCPGRAVTRGSPTTVGWVTCSRRCSGRRRARLSIVPSWECIHAFTSLARGVEEYHGGICACIDVRHLDTEEYVCAEVAVPSSPLVVGCVRCGTREVERRARRTQPRVAGPCA